MPSVTYMNQSAPFWDFLASLEQQGSQHPLFSQNRETENENEREQGHHENAAPQSPFAPWSWSQQLFGGPGGMPHRGPPPRGPHTHHRNHEEEAEKAHDEQSKDEDTEMNNDKDTGNDNDNGEGPSGYPGADNEHRPCGPGYHGRCGGRRNHRRFGAHHGPPHHHSDHEGRHHGPRGPWDPRARRNPWGGFGSHPLASLFDPSTYSGAAAFDPANIAAQFWNQFNDSHPSSTNNKDTTDAPEDYNPDADVFDTETAFVVHISLPGAKKEDVGVNWDTEKSELSVAGVIYRPGDEEFLKTLALSERKVGAFERRIRLGTRASPAHVDAEGITAKLEDGVLRVEVPKMDGGFVEIRKVDIE